MVSRIEGSSLTFAYKENPTMATKKAPASKKPKSIKPKTKRPESARPRPPKPR
jgi:hypothetical protein